MTPSPLARAASVRPNRLAVALFQGPRILRQVIQDRALVGDKKEIQSLVEGFGYLRTALSAVGAEDRDLMALAVVERVLDSYVRGAEANAPLIEEKLNQLADLLGRASYQHALARIQGIARFVDAPVAAAYLADRLASRPQPSAPGEIKVDGRKVGRAENIPEMLDLIERSMNDIFQMLSGANGPARFWNLVKITKEITLENGVVIQISAVPYTLVGDHSHSPAWFDIRIKTDSVASGKAELDHMRRQVMRLLIKGNYQRELKRLMDAAGINRSFVEASEETLQLDGLRGIGIAFQMASKQDGDNHLVVVFPAGHVLDAKAWFRLFVGAHAPLLTFRGK